MTEKEVYLTYEKCFECQYKYKFLDPSIHQNREPSRFSKFFRHLATNIMPFLAFNIVVIYLLALILYILDVNNYFPKILFGRYAKLNTGILSDPQDAYLLWASLIYVSLLFIIALINFVKINCLNGRN